MKSSFQSLIHCLLIVFALLLSACTQAQDQQDGISVAVRSVNYNADRGVTFILYDVSEAPNPKYKADPYVELQIDGYYPAGGGNLMALAGGGRECCINLPKQWREGIKYTVLWRAEADLKDEQIYRYTGEIPRYTQPEDLTVVFYPEHKVEFVIGNALPGEEGWNGQEKLEPLEACMAKNEKKFCYMYLPHYENYADSIAEWTRKKCRNIFSLSKQEAEKISSWTKQDCNNWQKHCLEDKLVSDTKMCNINWRSSEWGE